MRSHLLALLVFLPTLAAQTFTWVPHATAVAPLPPSSSFQVAADPHGGLLAYGSQAQQLYRWNGTSWLLEPGVGAPPPALIGAATFDSVRDRFVLLLGDQSTGMSHWEWDRQGWTQLPQPPMLPRANFGLAFDAGRGEAVLFGGFRGSAGMSDTWEWNGARWHQVSSGGPFPRWATTMSYDPARGVTLLFGGLADIGGQQELGDTWEWNGTFWREYFGVAGPSARHFVGLAFDVLRQRTILFGGGNRVGGLNETWEWDGAAWAQRAPSQSPPPASQLAFDPARGVPVLADPTALTQWDYVAAPSVAASFTRFGQGCGAAVSLDLDVANGSLPRLGSALDLRVTGLPAVVFPAPVAILIGFDAASWNGVPLPLALDPLGFLGCHVYLAPEFLEIPSYIGQGPAAQTLPIPVVIAFLGAHFYVQAVANDPLAPGGLVFSNAGQAVIGTP